MRLPFLLLPLPLLLIPLWKEVAGQASKAAFDAMPAGRGLPTGWKLTGRTTDNKPNNLESALDLRFWHVGIQSAPEYWKFSEYEKNDKMRHRLMPTYAWGNPHFICVNVPHMWYGKDNPADKANPSQANDARRWSRFPTPYSLFWIDEPTSFRWNRRFDFAPINVRPNIPGWEPHYKPDVLYKVDAERWKDRENIDTMGLHFRVEVTGVKELLQEESFDIESKTELAKDGYLKGWYHLKITLNEKEKQSEKYFIDRMVVSARGLSWSVSTDGSYHQWALGSKYADQVLSHKPRRTWQGGIGEFVYDFPRTVEDGRDGSVSNAKEFSFVRRQFIPCSAAQPTQAQLGNNFFYVRAKDLEHSQKYGGKWNFTSGQPLDDQPIELYYRLDQSFCNKFIAIDFVVNGVAIHVNAKPEVNKWDWDKWMDNKRKPAPPPPPPPAPQTPPPGPNELTSFAVEASSSTRIVFLKDVTDTDLMDKSEGSTKSVIRNRLNLAWMWENGYTPVFYENADPIPRHRVFLTNAAPLREFNRAIPMEKQTSDSFKGAIKEVVDPASSWTGTEPDRGLTWSFWDLYHLPEDPGNEPGKFQPYRDLVVKWHFEKVKEWNWWTPNDADGMPNHWPAVKGDLSTTDLSSIQDTLLYVPPNGNWKTLTAVQDMEGKFIDPTNLPYFDSTPLAPFIPYLSTDKGPDKDNFLPKTTFKSGEKVYDERKDPAVPELFLENRRDGIVGRHNGYYFSILRNYPVISGRSGGIWAKSLFYGAEFAPQPCDLFQSVYYVSGTDFKKSELMALDQLKEDAHFNRVGSESKNALENTLYLDDKNKNWDADDAIMQINPTGTIPEATSRFRKPEDKFNMYSYANQTRGQWRVTFKNYEKSPINPIATADPILRYLRWWMKKEKEGKRLISWTEVYYNPKRFESYCAELKKQGLTQYKCPEIPANPATRVPPMDRIQGGDHLIIFGDYSGDVPSVDLTEVDGAPLAPYGDGGPFGPGGPYGPGGPFGFGGPGGICGPSPDGPIPPPPGVECPPLIPGQPGVEGGPGAPYGPGGPFGPGGKDGPPLDPVGQTIPPFAEIPTLKPSPVEKDNSNSAISGSGVASIRAPLLPEIARKGKLVNTPYALFIWDSRLIHGVTMTILTFLVLPVNLFLTRYYKETFNDSRAFLHHVWYFAHIMGAAIVLFMFLYGMWRQYESRYSLGVSLMMTAGLHRGVGWTVIVISVLLTLTGGIRHMSTKVRAALIAVHWGFGTLVYIGLLVCQYSALGIPASPAAFNDVSEKNFGIDTMTDEVVFWMATVWIMFDLGMHIAMTMLQCKHDKSMKLTRPRLYLPTPIPVLNENYRFDSPGRQCRIHMLRLYIVIAAFVTVVPCYAMYSYNPRRRGVGFMSCTHFFNKSTGPPPTNYEENERWILDFEFCSSWPKKCGGLEKVRGCDS